MARRYAQSSAHAAASLLTLLQFFITTAITTWLDGRHVVFGEVLEGYDIVDKIQDVEKLPGDKPAKTVKIAKSGEIELTAEEKEQGIHVELLDKKAASTRPVGRRKHADAGP